MHPAVKAMHAFNAEFPFAKDCYKTMQIAHRHSVTGAVTNNADWEFYKNLFFPSQQCLQLHPPTTALLQANENKFNETSFKCQRILNGLHLFGAWRNTLGIYKLDDDIAKDIKPLPLDTPTHIFANLPEWAVYMDLSNISLKLQYFDIHNNLICEPIRGFWAVYDLVKSDYGIMYALNLIVDINDKNHYAPMSVILNEDLTIGESIKYGFSLDMLSGEQQDEKVQQAVGGLIAILLSYVLWLTSKEPYISHKNEPISKEQLSRPKHGINKKTGNFVPPNEPFFYAVGTDFGNSIRDYQKQIDDFDKDPKQGKGKRPHIRKGHWHGYWYGTGQGKEFKMKWLPAVFVNG